MTKQPKILVVDDSPTQLLQIQILLESEGFEVITAGDGREALDLLAEVTPDVIVTDLQMPNMDGLELVTAIARQQLLIPVILTTAAGSEMIAAEALHAGATSYVPKSGIGNLMISTVQRLLELRQATETDRQLAKRLTSVAHTYTLGNDRSLVPILIGRVEMMLKEFGVYDTGQQMQLAMALDEAVINSMIHGNLEVDSCLQHEGDSKKFYEKVRERSSQQPYSDRNVYVEIRVDLEGVTCIITDEGPGFDICKVADCTASKNLDREGGRGLLLINTFMDHVEHNSRGNQITMRKKFSPAPAKLVEVVSQG